MRIKDNIVEMDMYCRILYWHNGDPTDECAVINHAARFWYVWPTWPGWHERYT